MIKMPPKKKTRKPRKAKQTRAKPVQQQNNKVIVNISGYRKRTNNNRVSQPRVQPQPQYFYQQRVGDFSMLGEVIKSVTRNANIQPANVRFVGDQQPQQQPTRSARVARPAPCP